MNYSDTQFIHIYELAAAGEAEDNEYGTVGVVISYHTWHYSGVSVLVVPQFPPYGETK
jgi:hypothetical protein